MFVKIAPLWIVLSLFAVTASAEPKQWQTYDGYNPEGYGRHIVFISGDEEYRSEETLPQLAKILAVRHGFKCTVLFAQDPEKPGIINPQILTNIPGLEALRTADCMVIATRFRALPDAQMEEIDAYLKSGRPVIGMRTANHGFRFPKGSKWEHYNWLYKGEKSEWAEGFGGLVLGSWFFSHHGWHGHESTRGIIEKGKQGHQILKGIQPGNVWGATDVYGVKEPIPGDDVEILLRGQVLSGMAKDSKPLGPGPYEKAPEYVKNGSNNKNDPMQALAWTKSYQIPGGREGRAFCTTLGASLDLQAEGTRKLLVNAVYWSLGMAAVDPDVQIVGEYEPTSFKTYKKEHWEKRQLKVADFDLKTELHPRTTDKPASHYESSLGGREGFGYDFANHPINRDRIYHFYSRQAAHFMAERKAGKELPPLLPHFPEVDGLENGHWGKYHKNSYRDRRFNIMDHGNVFAGIFRVGKRTLPRAFAVSLSDDLHYAFDPVTLHMTHIWEGDFLKFNPSRWGIGGGISPGGKILRSESNEPLGVSIAKGSRYIGHRRRGDKVTFQISSGQEQYHLSAKKIDGKLVMLPTSEIASKWKAKYADKSIILSGKIGTQIPGTPFAIDRIPVPHHNEFGSPMLIGGHDFFSNGDAAVCTMAGDIWRVTGLDADLKKVTWTRIATGLNQPLGLSIFDDKIYVVGRDRISRLHDENGDGEIDFYENFCDDFPSSPGGHDFYTGLQRDGNGYFYFVAANSGVVKVAPDGSSAEVIATGLRNANGIGASSSGVITTSTNEGDWTPASAVFEVREGDFYGRKATKDGPPIAPALAYIPRGIDNSSGGQIFVDSKKWGPLQNQLLHFSFGAGTWSMILRDTGKDGERTQGAVVPLPGDFESGAHRGRFSPLDGQLYVSGSDGWGNYAITDGSFARVRYITGADNPYPTGWKAHRNGIVVRFSIPITAASVKPENFLCQTWNYQYGDGYGSLEFSLKQPGIPGHDSVAVKSAHLLKDGYSIFLEMPGIQPAMQFHIFGKLESKKSDEDITLNMFPTILHLAKDFTGFKGYAASLPDKITKLTLPIRWPIPFSPKVPNGKPGRKITIEAVSGLQYSPKQITVKAGEQITIEFKNTDSIPHNFVLAEKDSLLKVGTAANMMLSDPKAAEMHYAPDLKEVIHYTPMIYRNGRYLLHVKAPETPGKYPYLCTFPGHWAVMNGVMVVE